MSSKYIQFLVDATTLGKKGFLSVSLLALKTNINGIPHGLNAVRAKIATITDGAGSYLITLDESQNFKIIDFEMLSNNIRLAKVRWKTKIPRLLIAFGKEEHEANTTEKEIVYQWHPILKEGQNPIGYVRLVPSINKQVVSLDDLKIQLPQPKDERVDYKLESEITLS